MIAPRREGHGAEERPSVMIPSLAALILLAAAASGPACEGPAESLVIDVHARALEPGEPVRIVVHAAEPLKSVEGLLHGEKLTFVPVGAAGRDATRWSA